MLANLWLGVAAGLVAGACLGLGEALYILTSGRPSEYVALFYACAFYGLLGGLAGLIPGVLASLVRLVGRRLEPPLVYTLAFLAVFGPAGVGINYGVIGEALYRNGRVPTQALFSLTGVFGLLGLLGLWLLPILLTRTPFKILLRTRGTLALYSVVLMLSAVFSLSPATSSDPRGTISPDRFQPPELAAAPNLLLLVVEGLRLDGLGTYGGPPTPEIDALAARSVVFEQFMGHASWTRPSMASLFTSALPSTHTCQTSTSLLPDAAVTLAEVLQGHGYLTGAAPNSLHISQNFNFQQGFDWYDYQAPVYPWWATETASRLSMYRLLVRVLGASTGAATRVVAHYQPAEEVFSAARTFLDANVGRRWFLFVHLMEPSPPFFSHGEQGNVAFTAERTGLVDGATKEALRAAYEGEVQELDTQIGRFLATLEAGERFGPTLVVLTSSRGQALGDHGGDWTSSSLYDEQIHLPLLIKLPDDGWAGARIPWQVPAMDLAPTLVQALDAPLPDAWHGEPVFGPDFQESLADTSPWWLHPASRPVIAEIMDGGQVLSAVRDQGWKLVRANDDNPSGLPSAALFDLRTDVGEETNLAGQGLPEQGHLMAALLGGLDEAERLAVDRGSAELDAAMAERLRVLGYVD